MKNVQPTTNHMKTKTFLIALLGSVTFASMAQAPTDYCSKIDRIEDKHFNRVNYLAPQETPIRVMKSTSPDEEDAYLLYFMTIDDHNTEEHQGLQVTFTDGTNFSKINEKVSVDKINEKKFGYFALATLSKGELELFKEKTITYFRLFTHNQSVSEEKGIAVREYLRCLNK